MKSIKIRTIGTFRHGLKPSLSVLICILVFSVVGLVLLRRSGAVVNSVSIEAESGSLATGAQSVVDDTASGAAFVSFGSGQVDGFIPRGFIESSDGAHNAQLASMGFNLSVAPANTSGLDAAATNGMKSIVWVGDYNNDTCQFEKSDAEVATIVNGVKNHAALVGYFIADEAEQASSGCTNMYAQLAARSNLIHSLDTNTSHYTMQVVSSQGTNLRCYDYEPFMGTSDVITLDIYPFRQDANYMPCVSDPSKPMTDIAQAIAAWGAQKSSYLAKHSGAKAPRMQAMLQDFEDTIWRRPTISELKQQWAAWQNSGMEAIWYFSWDWQGNSLDGFTSHHCEFKIQNGVASSC